MEERIKLFLSISNSNGYGNGDGYSNGDGNGNSYDDGNGNGDGDGDGDGDGNGYGYGDSNGNSNGYGNGDGDGNGYGNGDGYGNDDGDGYGNGYGDGDGIKMCNGDKVYIIDDIPTIIKNVRGNIAQGYIFHSDLTLAKTYIVKGNNKFVHGETLHEAYSALQEKLYDDSTEEERIEAFVKQFPYYSVKYKAKDLFYWHHVLTGSCRQGRLAFCKEHDIDIENAMYSVAEFINLTVNSYGGSIIKALRKAYINA